MKIIGIPTILQKQGWKTLRLLCWIVAFAAVALTSSWATRFYIWLHQPIPNLPVMVEGLKPDPIGTLPSADFTRRLLGQFPIGSQERLLLLDLWSDGFKLMPQQNAQFKHAELCSCFFGGLVVSVDWKTDGAGNITDIKGRYIAAYP